MISAFTLFNGASNTTAKELKQLFCTPAIGYPVGENASSLINTFSSLLAVGGVPIYTDKYSDSGESEIGKQVMIRSKGGAEQITDNVIPTPRMWTLSGYINGATIDVKSLTLVSIALDAALIQMQKNYIVALYNMRKACRFRTKEGESVNVFIKNYAFDTTPDIENVQPIKLTLLEANVLALNVNTLEQYTTASKTAGTWFGSSLSVGVATASAVSLTWGSGFEQFLRNNGWLDATEHVEDTTATSSLGSYINAEDTAAYVAVPSDIIVTNADGSVSYPEHQNFSVSYGAYSLSFDLLLDKETQQWHVTEVFSSGGTELESRDARLTFNSLMNRTSEYYAYVVMSKNAPIVPEAPSVKLSEPDPAAYGGSTTYAYLNAYSEYVNNKALWTTYEDDTAAYPDRVMKALASAVVFLVIRGENA